MDNIGWTSVEQSERLLESGLIPDTADMFYSPLDMHKTPWCWNSKRFLAPNDVPCWSLGALLDLLPKDIDIDWQLSWGGYDALKEIYTDEFYMSIETATPLSSYYQVSNVNLMDCVVDFVIYCIDKGYVNKTKNK